MIIRFLRLLTALAIVSALTACTESNGDAVIDPVYRSVLEKGEIEVGFIVYPPSFGVDPNSGEYYGISHDVLNLIASNMGLDVNYSEELAFGSMIESLNNNRIDLVGTGIWPSAARGLRAAFTNPFFYSPVYAYVKTSDDRFSNNLQSANEESVSIAVIDGEMSQTIAETSFPNARMVSLPQLTEVGRLLQQVASGKADITFVEPAIAIEYMDKNPGEIKRNENAEPVRAFPVAFMLKHESIFLMEALNVAIGEAIRSGEIEKILSKYEEVEDTFIRVDSY